ncbi:hypothetical protein NM688_g8167 [Phlebia brevispora]|uniref:Uncharacterized protein n=1 Tax=Phlebia brevispora TaxID=194682 RepID=A0ACC1RWE8_9APHY|nr:hypothetical protein NM688_g8167 [Phlebia brevispora]
MENLLPVELWQMVFEDLSVFPRDNSSLNKGKYNEAKRTLSSCTLVCKRWCTIARPYLFQDIRLTLENHNLEQIHEYFSTFTLLTNCVKTLHLARYDRRPRSPLVTRDGTLVDQEPSPKLSVVLLADTLRLFPKLRHVRFVDIFFANLTAVDAAYLHETSPSTGKLSVEVLEIVFNICFLDYSVRQQHILACFRSVDRLLVHGRAGWGSSHDSGDLLCIPQVRSLELADAAGTQQILTLLKSPSHGVCCLEELSIERINSGMTDDYPALQAMLDVVGPRLTRFRCNMARNPQGTSHICARFVSSVDSE